MNYTYAIPANLKQKLLSALRANGMAELANLLNPVVMEYRDLGFAYYAGVKGDNWDKHAIDCTITVCEKDVDRVKRAEKAIATWIERMLPGESGLVVRNIIVIPQLGEENITLPTVKGDTWEVLSEDITQALLRNEPTLVLDRLHTFCTRYIRELCDKKGICTVDAKNQHYPVHSLMGSLAKHYHQNGTIKSDFAEQALKTSISLFDKYNAVRNDHSYAHDNEILDKAEATLAIKIIAATISFVDEVESSLGAS